MAKQVSDEPADSADIDGEGMDYGEFKFLSMFGFIMAYFILSGSIATFIYLDWIGLAPAIADAVEPLSGAATGILGVFVVFLNTVLLVLLMVNSKAIVDLSDKYSRF